MSELFIFSGKRNVLEDKNGYTLGHRKIIIIIIINDDDDDDVKFFKAGTTVSENVDEDSTQKSLLTLMDPSTIISNPAYSS